MKGRRLYPLDDGTYPYGDIQPGDYFKFGDHWYCKSPNGYLGGLGNHKVEEHEDGTITVSPSILIKTGETDLWHGYLEHGTWREI